MGANGQLGAACCRALLERGHTVRGSVRSLERAVDLTGVELKVADLARAPDFDDLLSGMDAVVLTANTAVPRAGDDVERFTDGEHRLIDAAGRHGIGRIVLPSIPETDVDADVPIVAERRQLEQHALESVPGSVVLRLPPFMEVWLALVGSEVPLRGEPHATIGRPSPFLRTFRRLTGSLVERRGVMLVPGPTRHRQAFIAVRDAATACARAVERADVAGRVIDVAGPEVLTWNEVARTYSDVLGRPVRAVSAPVPVFAALAALLRKVAGVPARTMALNRFVGSSESAWPRPGGGLVDAGEMTTVAVFLRSKMALPPRPPTVV
ncbi:NAD(P)H-binding protein [Rothia sp. ARF10]|nr:NAD(P)H-binding protein [Rothia sp. ARF10]